MANPGILVVVPTYNEAENILPLVRALLAHPADLHVLVVDDQSPDGTGELVEAEQSRMPAAEKLRLHLLRRPEKQGLGNAYRHAMVWALEQGYSKIVQMDADFSHSPEDLHRLLEASDSSDLVLGSRYIPDGKIVGWSAYRQLLSRCANIYARWVIGLPLHDLTGGFKCYRREALLALDISTLHSGGYTFQLETTTRVVRQGFRVSEVPITYRERVSGKSKISSVRTIVETLALVLRLGLQRTGSTRTTS